jgi:phytoene/squalene synthetase
VSHYENFPVASWLCPPRLRPAIAAIYAFARTADDIADEGDATPAARLADLAAFRADLHAAARGESPSHDPYVQQKAAASGSSFYYAFLFLPKPRRAAITAFYAFCREVDDVVDEVSDPGVARTKLAWWQAEVPRPLRASPPTR